MVDHRLGALPMVAVGWPEGDWDGARCELLHDRG